MPKITDSSYPLATELDSDDVALVVQDGEVRRSPQSVLTNWTTAQTIEAVAGTTYTVVAADANKIKRLAATATVTLPSAGPTTGQRVDFVCVGGAATFVLGSGATWDVTPTPSAVARAVGSMVTAVKMTATAWALTGDLA